MGILTEFSPASILMAGQATEADTEYFFKMGNFLMKIVISRDPTDEII